MKVIFKITRRLFTDTQADLLRPHAFAAERVGWLRCRIGQAPDGALLILAHDFHPVQDADYLDDRSVGAMMGPAAIRKALQLALMSKAAIFHVHMHDHEGRPGFSGIDSRETAKFVPDFWHVRPELPHGALVFSRDRLYGRCWYPGGKVLEISEAVIVGAPLVRFSEAYGQPTRQAKLSRNR
jgi:hypothetical protein